MIAVIGWEERIGREHLWEGEEEACPAAKLRMRLLDWIRRNGGRDEDLQAAYLLPCTSSVRVPRSI